MMVEKSSVKQKLIYIFSATVLIPKWKLGSAFNPYMKVNTHVN